MTPALLLAQNLLAQNFPPPTEPIGPIPILVPDVDWLSVGPEVVLAAAGLILVTITALHHGQRNLSALYLQISLAGVAVAGGLSAKIWSVVQDEGPYQTIRGMVAVDGFSVYARMIILAATALGLLIAHGYLKRENIRGPEYHALLLFSACGMLLMTSANDLIVVFLALEILSIALYVLAAFDRHRLESQEAGLKYFVLGAFSSAVFLYGVAMVYGATGTTSLPGVAAFLSANTLPSPGLLVAGAALLLVGLGFKVAAVPFHMWTPDVYQGSPTPVTGFMAAGAKAAGFAALLRVYTTALQHYSVDWKPLVWVLAVASLLLGSIVAIAQNDVKRMLAYSSINHAGYVLMGFQADSEQGVSSALFYLFCYTFMILGSFAVVTVVGRQGDRHHSMDDYRGLGARQPVLAGILTFFLLAQAGVPLTSGFVAKFTVFSATVEAREYGLAIVGVLTTVIAAFFYLRLIVQMYMTAPKEGTEHDDADEAKAPAFTLDGTTSVALAVTCVTTLVVGVFPNALIDLARDATFLF